MIVALQTASSPLLRELRIVAVTLLDRRGSPLAKLWFLFCLSYLFVPLDIIPDRTPYVGHLDEAAAVLLGLLGAWLLTSSAAPAPAGLRGVVPPGLGMAARGARSVAGRASVDLFATALAAPVMRLMLGRWPEPLEVAQFRLGLRRNSSALPPLLRAIAHVPTARGLVNRTMLLASTVPPDAASAHGIVAVDHGALMGDPMRIWRGPKIGFLHLEKTAGSSLTTFLTGLFHPLQIDPDPNRVLAPETTRLAERDGHRPDAERSLVWGHYDLATLRGLGPDRFLLTVLREPRARILSLYHYFRANDGDDERRVRLAHELSLLDYLRSGEPDAVNMVDNLYVRRLTGAYAGADGHDPLRTDPDAALAQALDRLEALDFVGLAEDMDATLATLGRMLGFTPPTRAPRANVLAENEANPFLPFRTIARARVTDEIAVELDRLTRLDRVVYERGRRRFEALRARV